MGDGVTVDAMVGALTDPFDDCHMGITAENVANKWGVTREDQDALAVESHRRAGQASAEGWFRDQILPVEVRSGRKTVTFDTDEHIRADVDLEAMARLRARRFPKHGSLALRSNTSTGCSGMTASIAGFCPERCPCSLRTVQSVST